MTLRLVRSRTSDNSSLDTRLSLVRPPMLRASLPARSPRSKTTQRLTAKVARLVNLSDLGTDLIEKLVDQMLDEFEGRTP